MAKNTSSQLKMTMEELEQMERRLKTVQEKCMSKEEREAREKNRFNIERKKGLDALKKIKKDLEERDSIRRARGDCKESIMLNAKSRTALKDVVPIVTYVSNDALNAERVGGANPAPEQKQIIDTKKRGAEHLKKTYDLVSEMYQTDISNQGAVHSELMEGVEQQEEVGFFSRLFGGGKPKDSGVKINPDSIPAVSSTNIQASPMEDQWMALEQEDQQVEDQYLGIISENVATLNQFAHAFGNELDKQDALIDQLQTKTDKETQKLEKLNEQVDKANKMTTESNRCIYIIIFVIIAAVVAFILIKFIF